MLVESFRDRLPKISDRRLSLLRMGVVGVLAVSACASDELVQHQYEGTLGNSRIGMTVLRAGNTIKGGHYFYQRFLKDIPIEGAVEGSSIVLREASGGTFRLHFVGNGSEGGQPLDFDNSVRMEGTWVSTKGAPIYPVILHGTTSREGAQDRRRYANVTDEEDNVFEKRVQSLLRSVLHGEKMKAVRFISYPLAVNYPGHTRTLKDSAAVLAAWNDLFTPALMAKLETALPHDMFVHHGLAMLCNGEVWFDADGLKVLNIPGSTVPVR